VDDREPLLTKEDSEKVEILAQLVKDHVDLTTIEVL